ncbi:hypothetical protein VPH35_095836 [Triticum aestivum]|uniref:Uncharacterized protein n=1 Tax=Aegilops tauschii TaxID=37682 RepID=M8C8X4_AEGTA
MTRIYREEQAVGSEGETYLDPDDRAGEAGEAHGDDNESIRRREGTGVAGEHAKLECLLEHFSDWIRRRSGAKERCVSLAPLHPPPAEPRAGTSMLSSRASSATSTARFDMKGRKISGCEARAGYGYKGRGGLTWDPPAMEGGSWRWEKWGMGEMRGAVERMTARFLVLYYYYIRQ